MKTLPPHKGPHTQQRIATRPSTGSLVGLNGIMHMWRDYPWNENDVCSFYLVSGYHFNFLLRALIVFTWALCGLGSRIPDVACKPWWILLINTWGACGVMVVDDASHAIKGENRFVAIPTSFETESKNTSRLRDRIWIRGMVSDSVQRQVVCSSTMNRCISWRSARSQVKSDVTFWISCRLDYICVWQLASRCVNIIHILGACHVNHVKQ